MTCHNGLVQYKARCHLVFVGPLSEAMLSPGTSTLQCRAGGRIMAGLHSLGRLLAATAIGADDE